MAGWLPYLNKISGRDLAEKDVHMWGLEHVYNLPFSKVRKPLHKPGFWEMLPPYPGAVEFVKKLTEVGYDVYIATAPFPSENCMWEKKKWVDRVLYWLPPTRTIFIHDKHILEGDMLIDDKPENLVSFTGTRVLFDRPWNRNLRTGILEKWFIRVTQYSDILGSAWSLEY